MAKISAPKTVEGKIKALFWFLIFYLIILLCIEFSENAWNCSNSTTHLASIIKTHNLFSRKTSKFRSHTVQNPHLFTLIHIRTSFLPPKKGQISDPCLSKCFLFFFCFRWAHAIALLCRLKLLYCTQFSYLIVWYQELKVLL